MSFEFKTPEQIASEAKVAWRRVMDAIESTRQGPHLMIPEDKDFVVKHEDMRAIHNWMRGDGPQAADEARDSGRRSALNLALGAAQRQHGQYPTATSDLICRDLAALLKA